MIYYSMVYNMSNDRFDHPLTEGDIFMLKKENRTLTLAFLLILISSAVIRVVLSIFPKSAYTYNDELFYLELSQNLFLRGSLTVYGSPIHFTKLLYSVILAPFYAVSDGVLRTQLISGFNALLISSSLIPGYLLARRILKKNWQIILALLFLALSPNLLFSITFMSENLYYPLLLWAFYAAYRYFASGERKPLGALILGILAFLLYFTKEVGGAWIIAAGLALLLDCADKSSRNKALRAFGCFLLGFLVPFLFLRFVVLRDLSYSYSNQASFANLSSPSQILYFLYAALLMLLYFVVSLLFIPAAAPVVYHKQLSPAERFLLTISVLYAVVISVGIAFGVSLSNDYPQADPNIHLRYFIGAAFPFLLLSFSLLDQEESFSWKGPLVKATAGFTIIFLLTLAFPPNSGSVVDHPVLFFTRLIQDSVLWSWLSKGILVLLILVALILWSKKRKLAFVCLLLPVTLALELFSGILFTQTLTREEAIQDTDFLAEVRQLDTFLDSADGPILMLADSAGDPQLKLTNTISNDDYSFATIPSVKDLAAKAENAALVQADLSANPLPHPYVEYAPGPTYDSLSDVSWIVSLGDQDVLDRSRNEEITPDGLTSFHVYRAQDPSRLALYGPITYTLGDPILFYGTKPSFRKYQPTGFSVTEDGYTWTDGTEASLTLVPNIEEPCDLSGYWTWRWSMGTQICQLFANDTILGDVEIYPGENDLYFYIPSYAYEGAETLTLRFLFPTASPTEDDPRLLAFAFETLTLEAEE